MQILSSWRTAASLLSPRSLYAFLSNVIPVAWRCYKTIAIYFWWVTLIIIAYIWEWHLVLCSAPACQAFFVRVLREFVSIFESGYFFLIISYTWVITTHRSLPRVVDYFIRLLYFSVPYVFLQEAALFVQEHTFSFGVFISAYSFIVLVLYAFFLLDAPGRLKTPFISIAYTFKMIWHVLPFILSVGLVGGGLEVVLLATIRYSMLGVPHSFIQHELFYIFLPVLVSFFSLFYAENVKKSIRV